jgi:hypothetical protein
LAATQTALRRHADALDNLDRTLLLPATKLTEQPRCEVRLDRCRALARLGRHEQALAEAEALSSPATLTGLLHYRHAEVYALAATAIRADERLPESLRSARAEEYAAKAVTLLDKAREAGQFKEEAERAWLKRDPDLDLLRPRRDYVDFARRVEEK